MNFTHTVAPTFVPWNSTGSKLELSIYSLLYARDRHVWINSTTDFFPFHSHARRFIITSRFPVSDPRRGPYRPDDDSPRACPPSRSYKILFSPQYVVKFCLEIYLLPESRFSFIDARYPFRALRLPSAFRPARTRRSSP